jgi:uncharacterized BrkB/YihY/UPF0761 family membrane protein
MRLLGHLLGAALIAAPLSVLAVILYFVIDDPCGCAQPSDDCGYGYLAAIILVPIGFVVFFAAWAVALNVRLRLRSRVACGLAASMVILGGFGGFGAYYEYVYEPPPYQQGGC